MVHSDALQARLDQLLRYLRARIREGRAFEGSFKFSPQQVETNKKFVWRVTLDNPTEGDATWPEKA